MVVKLRTTCCAVTLHKEALLSLSLFVIHSSPDAPVPDFSKKGTEERENDSSDSESSFSDC